MSGWVIAREGWMGSNTGMIVFMAREGHFTAADLITGALGPFLVMRTATGTYVPWVCGQTDALASDWAAITRQTFARQVRSDERPTPEMRRGGFATSGSKTSGFATEDSDFNAD